jgi:hypothetical protein
MPKERKKFKIIIFPWKSEDTGIYVNRERAAAHPFCLLAAGLIFIAASAACCGTISNLIR